VLWAPNVVDPTWIRENTRRDAELVDVSRCSDDEVQGFYRRAASEKLRLVRLCQGDPATWSELRRQIDACGRLGLPTEVIAGVSAVSTAAVSLGAALTEPDFADSVILSGVDATGIPDPVRIREFAQHGTTMAVMLPAVRATELVEALCSGGFDQRTPVVVAYKVSWPDELIVRITLGELIATVKQHRLWRHTLFLVGGALRPGKTKPTGRTPAPRSTESARRYYRPTDGSWSTPRWATRAKSARRSTSDASVHGNADKPAETSASKPAVAQQAGPQRTVSKQAARADKPAEDDALPVAESTVDNQAGSVDAKAEQTPTVPVDASAEAEPLATPAAEAPTTTVRAKAASASATPTSAASSKAATTKAAPAKAAPVKAAPVKAVAAKAAPARTSAATKRATGATAATAKTAATAAPADVAATASAEPKTAEPKTAEPAATGGAKAAAKTPAKAPTKTTKSKAAKGTAKTAAKSTGKTAAKTRTRSTSTRTRQSRQSD
jgi:precorrin-4/cobalt-precorrin-4 C11-methyltransferase